METDLNPDGPHSPEYTRELGNALAEAVRCLNYATRDDAPGLDYPADAYSLLGALYTATQRLPQLMQQVAAFLESQSATRCLADSRGGDPAMVVLDATVGLAEAILTAQNASDDYPEQREARLLAEAALAAALPVIRKAVLREAAARILLLPGLLSGTRCPQCHGIYVTSPDLPNPRYYSPRMRCKEGHEWDRPQVPARPGSAVTADSLLRMLARGEPLPDLTPKGESGD